MLVDRDVMEMVRRIKGRLGLDETRVLKLAVSNLAAQVAPLPMPRPDALVRLKARKAA